MLVDWLKSMLALLGLSSSDYETITIFNFSFSLETLCLIVYLVWFILLVVVLAKKFHKHL